MELLDFLWPPEPEYTNDDRERDSAWLASPWSDSQSGYFSREETAERLATDWKDEFYE